MIEISINSSYRKGSSKSVGPVAVRKSLQEFKAAGLISPTPSSSLYDKIHKSSIR